MLSVHSKLRHPGAQKRRFSGGAQSADFGGLGGLGPPEFQNSNMAPNKSIFRASVLKGPIENKRLTISWVYKNWCIK